MNQILLGDCLDVLKTLPDESVDSVVCDPPYGLGTREPTGDEIVAYLQGLSGLGPLRKGKKHCANSIIRSAVVPKSDDLVTAFGQQSVSFKVRVHGASLVTVRTVQLDNEPPLGEVEVCHIGSVGELDNVLVDEIDSPLSEDVDHCHLCLRETESFSGCVEACCCFTKLSESLVRIVVRLVDDSPGEAEGASLVMASRATEVEAVLTLDLFGRTGNLRPADSALDQGAGRLLLSAETVGTGSRAASISTVVKHLLSSEVRLPTNGALTCYVSLPGILIERFHSNHVRQKDFMGEDWEIPPVSVWRECLRVLKPGGHLLCFGGTRTFDLISIGIRAAGFECRDTIASQFAVQCLQWLQGSGFPKSTSMKRVLEKMGLSPEEVERWSGWGTNLKPSWEPILCYRRPLAESTIAKQVLATGTGAINIDACRVGTTTRTNGSAPRNERSTMIKGMVTGTETVVHNHGRWPANLAFTHLPTCKVTGTKRVPAPVINRFDDGMKPFGDGAGHKYTSEQTGDHDGNETIPVYECEDGCPVRALDAQSGERSVSGSAKKGVPTAPPSGNGFLRGNGVGDTGYVPIHTYPNDAGGASRYFSQFEPDPTDEPVYECTDGCPVKALDEQSGHTTSGVRHDMRASALGRMNDDSWKPQVTPRNGFPDSGGASRFFTQFESDAAVPVYECAEGCPVKALDEQSGLSVSVAAHRGRGCSAEGSHEGWKRLAHQHYTSTVRGHDDEGGASRYFTQFEPDAPFLYAPKVSKKERDAGLPKGTNKHPTCKPVKLLSWLARLVTPPGGTILDPFCGSGSMGVAAIKEGFNFIGIERDPEFHRVAELRVKAAEPSPDVFDELEQLE